MPELQTNGKAEVTNGDTPTTESKIPAWLTAEVFEEHLKEQIPDLKTISSFKPQAAMGAGENYATIMLRIEIEVELQDGKTRDITLMMKIPHQMPLFRDMMKKHNMFEIETKMYREVVPEFEQMYRKAGVEVRFGAKYYDIKTPAEELGVVTLEDLRPAGFKNANRLEGLDEEHIKCVLRRLAQWHAASAVRIETKGQYYDKLMNGFFVEEQREVMANMMNGMSATLLDCMKTYKGHEVYEEKMTKLQLQIVDQMFSNAASDPNEFCVLNHGDCWSNNVMFQYDDAGKIKETYLVDYQLPRYGTPAQDLLYFLISSTRYELKTDKFDYFVRFYHELLAENLKLLKYPKTLPTLRDIHIALCKHGFWGYATATGVMAAVLLDPTESASFENFLGETKESSNFHRLMFSNDRFRKHIEMVLPWLNNRGALDC